MGVFRDIYLRFLRSFPVEMPLVVAYDDGGAEWERSPDARSMLALLAYADHEAAARPAIAIARSVLRLDQKRTDVLGVVLDSSERLVDGGGSLDRVIAEAGRLCAVDGKHGFYGCAVASACFVAASRDDRLDAAYAGYSVVYYAAMAFCAVDSSVSVPFLTTEESVRGMRPSWPESGPDDVFDMDLSGVDPPIVFRRAYVGYVSGFADVVRSFCPTPPAASSLVLPRRVDHG